MKLVGSSRAVRSPEFHKKKQVEKKVKAALVSALAIVIIAAPVFALRSEKLRLTDIVVTGNDVTSGESIREAASAHLSGAYLWLIPKSSSLLVNKDDIERSLIEEMPRLASAKASVDDSKTLSIAVTERTPFALYCQDVSDPDRLSKCFFLDETGYIFSEAPDFSGGVYQAYASDPVLQEPIRQQYLAEAEFRAVGGFIGRLPEFGLEPKTVTKAGDEYALVLEGGTILKWREEQDLDSLSLDLEAFLKGLKVNPLRYQELLYIDLRFENKVFYKFRD